MGILREVRPSSVKAINYSAKGKFWRVRTIDLRSWRMHVRGVVVPAAAVSRSWTKRVAVEQAPVIAFSPLHSGAGFFFAPTEAVRFSVGFTGCGVVCVAPREGAGTGFLPVGRVLAHAQTASASGLPTRIGRRAVSASGRRFSRAARGRSRASFFPGYWR